MTIEQEVIAIVAEQLGVEKGDITPAKSFVEDLNADSLDLTELIMTLEEKFDIEIAEDKAEKLKNVRDVIESRTQRCAIESTLFVRALRFCDVHTAARA